MIHSSALNVKVKKLVQKSVSVIAVLKTALRRIMGD